MLMLTQRWCAGWAFPIPGALNDLPMYIIEVTVWSIVAYFACGFYAGAGRCALWVITVQHDVPISN